MVFPFVLVVVRRGDDEFLLVQEGGMERGSWFLPAGGVDPGEGLIEAAIRETREEAGIDVIPRALLWMEDETSIQRSGLWTGRWRFILRADPRDSEQVPRATGDDTLDARWFHLQEIISLPLRSPEVLLILRAVLKGHPETPLEQSYLRH
jgi:8-oxo-dGTP pyrophosphatase MutT (NUDIX family)